MNPVKRTSTDDKDHTVLHFRFRLFHKINKQKNRKLPYRTGFLIGSAAGISIYCLIITCISVVLGAQPLRGQVKAWEGTVTIPTYKWEEDVNPKFWAMDPEGNTRYPMIPYIYPYPMQDYLSDKKEDVTYKALFLENEYIKITCLPELGGRLYSVFNKITNREVFHKNSVIKPGRVVSRSPFLSGGVEWNAGPQSHTVTLLSPVDALTGKNDDGSAFIEVSNVEKSLRTAWTVRVTLHPGKSYLEEDFRLFNPAEAMNPYYFWNCTAFPDLPGIRFIFPMSLATDHNCLKFFNWPLNKDSLLPHVPVNKDLTLSINYEFRTSIFAVNCAYGFFGAYNKDSDYGIVAVSNPHEHQGKKAWVWGQGRYGQTAQRLLTDNDGNYVEIQSGPLQTQLDYGLFAPGNSISWKEYWYPVYGLGDGFEFATEKVAIQTKSEKNNLEIRMISTEKIPGAMCKIISGDRIILKKQVHLTPSSATSVIFNKTDHKPFVVSVEGADGEVIARFKTPLPIPEVNPPAPPAYAEKPVEILSAEELWLKAAKYDRALDRANARKYYEMALGKDSVHLASLRDMAIMDFEAGLYKKASSGFEKALRQVPNDDGLAWYFLGLCHIREGDMDAALRCGFKASRCIGTVSSGYDLAGRVYMLKKDYPAAEKQFIKSYQADQNNPRIFHHLLLAKYAFGKKEESIEMASQRIRQFPSELVPKLIKALQERNLNDKAAEIRNFTGEDDFQITEAGFVFSNLGLEKETTEILETLCIDEIPQEMQNPLVLYQLGYLYYRIGNTGKATFYLDRATKSYRDFIWASRPEEEEALKYALSCNPDDALANYHLGNLYAGSGRLKEASELWNKAVMSDPSMSVPWRNLGLFYWLEKNNHKKSEACFLNAIKARPSDQALYRDLAKLLAGNGKRDEAINLSEKMLAEDNCRSDMIVNLATYYLEGKSYDECIQLLTSDKYFINWDGSIIPSNLFIKANVEKGIELYNRKYFKDALKAFENALSFPGNLHVGRDDTSEDSRAWFWKGKALISLGRKTEAYKAWTTGSRLPKGTDEQNRYISICSELSK